MDNLNICLAYGVIIDTKRAREMFNLKQKNVFRHSSAHDKLMNRLIKIGYYKVNKYNIKMSIDVHYEGECCNINKKKVFIGFKSTKYDKNYIEPLKNTRSITVSSLSNMKIPEGCCKNLVDQFCQEFFLGTPELMLALEDCGCCS